MNTSVRPKEVFLEHEVSRLNEKLSAMEVKLNALQAEIEARRAAIPERISYDETTSSASAPDPTLPNKVKNNNVEPKVHVETEFKTALKRYQEGKYLDASMQFYEVSKNYSGHLLASHALFWAGDAHARSGQWTMATKRWEELTTRYPKSIFIPDAFAGLAQAFSKQNNAERAGYYRNILYKNYPDAPATLNLLTSDNSRNEDY